MSYRRYIVYIVICLFAEYQPSQAQTARVYADSVRAYLYAPRPDTGKYYLLLKLAQLPECPPDTLLAFGNYWYNYSEKQHLTSGRPEALYIMGLALFRKGMNQESTGYLYKAAAIWEKNGQNQLQLGRTYELIAGIHKIMQQHANALTYYRMAFQVKKTLNNEAILMSTYNGLGNMFRLLKQTDSAAHYLAKAYTLAEGNELAKAQVSLNLGNIYWSLKNWPVARQWYNKALQSFETLKQPEGIAEASFNLGAIATQLKEYTAAIAYYNKSLEAVPTGQPVEHLEWIYEHLADAYSHTGQFENAYNNEVAYLNTKDSMYSVQVQQSIADLKEKYETEKKEQALVLEKERTARLQSANSQKLRLIFLLAGVALLITVMGYIIARNIRRKQLLAAELVGLKEKEKQQLIQEQALKSNIAMLEGREAERQRIARDLHDRLGSTLSSVRLFMKSNNNGSATVAPANEKIMLLLEEAVNDVRCISHDLSDNILIKYGLEEALKDIQNTIEAGGSMQVTLYQQPVHSLSPDIAAEIYYIVRELAANAVKHSGASNLFIQLLQEDRQLILTVEDDGCGLDPKGTHKGIGLHNIETRAKKIRAQYTIDASVGKGSCFFFTIPLS